MPIHEKVNRYLAEAGVEYEAISHGQTFSSVEEARALGIEADEIAKNVILAVDEGQAFVIVPGDVKLDVKKFRRVAGFRHARLVTEEEMAANFPGFEVGAVPPLGKLFGVPVYVDQRLLEHETVVFPGGSHRDSIRMKCRDLINLNTPTVLDLVKEPSAA